jgi:VWFA-related protein
MIRPVCALLLCGLLAAQQTTPPKQTAPAQQREAVGDQPETVIRTTVQYVSTPVWVYDRDGDYVNGLQADQFRLFDNSKEQQVKVDVSFTPMSLVLCVQANSHVQGLLPQVKKIGALIKPLLTGDQGEVALIAYDSRVRRLQEFTSDAEKISTSLSSIYPGSDANHMIDAVAEATRMLRSRPPTRQRIILLIGETRDLYSEMHLREAMIDLQLANIVFYAVDMSRFVTTLTAPAPAPRWDNRDATMMGNATLPSGVPATPTSVMQATGSEGGTAQFLPLMIELFRDAKAIFKDNPVEAFTKATGGTEYGFHSQRTLEDAIQRLGEQLHSNYMISYQPNNRTEFGFHKIEVEVTGRRDVRRVQTRPGYWIGQR